MGGSESKADTERPQMVKASTSFNEASLKFLRQLDDPKYGQCKVFKSDYVDFQIAFVTQLKQKSSDADVKELLESYQAISNLKHSSVIQLLKYSIQKKSQLCSSHIAISLFYEYAGNSLENDMKRRQGNGLFYEENELWHVIVQVVAAIAFLESRGIEHGDIQPSSLLLNPNGQVKILPRSITQTALRLNNYMQAFMGMKKAKYLSPKLLLGLEQQSQSPVHDSAKSDAFSLGLVILEAALLQEQDDIFDYDEFEFNNTILEMKLQYVKEKYSNHLVEFLRVLLVKDEMQRMTIKQVFSLIEKLCAEGVSMSDCIYSANYNDRMPTYNFSVEDGKAVFLSSGRTGSINFDTLTTEQEDIIKRAPAIHFQDDQARRGVSEPKANLSSRPVQREEKVRRSKWTLKEFSDYIDELPPPLITSTVYHQNGSYFAYLSSNFNYPLVPRLAISSINNPPGYTTSRPLLLSQREYPIPAEYESRSQPLTQRELSDIRISQAIEIKPYVYMTRGPDNQRGIDDTLNKFQSSSTYNKQAVY